MIYCTIITLDLYFITHFYGNDFITNLVNSVRPKFGFRYREPKPGLNFGISIGAITFSAETEIAFSTNFDFCQTADWKI